MKQLTNFAVVSVMNLLIHTNGQTTTLEIKNQLRDLGYRADQSDVHELVEVIYDALTDIDNGDIAKYERTPLNSTYNVYKFTQEFIDQNVEFAQANDTTVNATLSQIYGMCRTNAVATPNNVIILPLSGKKSDLIALDTLSTNTLASDSISLKTGVLVTATKTTTNSREPLFIFYTENHVRKSGMDPENWVVFNKDLNNEFHIFDKSLTRDQVRSKYASTLKFKIQDVRACKFSNF